MYNLSCNVSPCFITASSPLTGTFQVPPVLDTSQWSSWGVCAPCPAGTRRRYRPCLAEYPQFGLTCITRQTPEVVTCACDCGTPTDDGSSRDSTLTVPSGTTVGSNVKYTCNNNKKWSIGTDHLFFKCTDHLTWEPVDNATKHSYGHGCVACTVPLGLAEATYNTLVAAVTTIDSEIVVNCSSGRQLPGGSTTTTFKCVWDEDVDSFQWVAETGSVNISVSSSFVWQAQINGEGKAADLKL